MVLARAQRTAPPVRGFTLVELLVVIFLIILLISILTPALSSAIASAKNARTKEMVTGLHNALAVYQRDNSYYPGQIFTRSTATSVIGKGDPPQQFTGAQWMVRGVLDCQYDANGNIDAAKSIAGKYFSSYSEGMLMEHNSRTHVFSDQQTDPLPILYYPSRLGNDGSAGSPSAPGARPRAYIFEDNSIHTAQTAGTFSNFVLDKRVSPYKAFNSDSFLLIAAGPDRKYFTPDDIKNWQN